MDFSSPVYANVSELVVSGPTSPAVSSMEDLAGQEVFVRKSSSYYESYVKDAASESERRRFLALMQHFQTYGDKHDVNWLVMAAQGYQESQLNQAARSKAGAIGVMQVMPATGKTLGVGDITKVEANIHAGVKYMRWMIDQ